MRKNQKIQGIVVSFGEEGSIFSIFCIQFSEYARYGENFLMKVVEH